MYEAVAGVSAELRLPRQGQRLDARAAARADARRRDRPEAARGLGHDAGRDRHVPRRGRRVRRAGGDSHRHAERSRLRRRHDRRDRRPDDSHLPHRRRRRRPRARHHPSLRRAERAALVDQPDDAVHEEYAGRAPRHADGVPSPVAQGARGRRVRRLAHPARDDRRRGRPARSRRDQHDVVRLAGDGPDRRGDLPHLADRRQDEAAARRRSPATPPLDDNLRVRRYIAKYTINPAIAHGICVRGRIDRGRQAGRPRAVEAGVLRRQAGADHQGRLHRRRDDGRRQRVDSDAAAGDRPLDVRRLRRGARRVQRPLRQPAGHRQRRARRAVAAGSSRCAAAAASASATWCSTTRCRGSR